MIRKMKTGEYRLYSRKKNQRTGKRRNLGTFASRQAAEKHERAVQFFKRKTGEYRLYSRKKNQRTGKRRNLGTFASRQAAEKHERAVQFFKRGG
jgi:hypothetical protein